MGIILIAILVSATGMPVMTTTDFSSMRACEQAKELIRETTQLRVDTLKCINK